MQRASFPGLGVQAGRVVVVDHDPGWSATYVEMAETVASALVGHEAQIEHVGSTSVPGLAAKPILDIAVGIPEPIDRSAVVEGLEGARFGYQGDFGDYGGLLFTLESSPEIVVVNLHVVDLDGFQWRWYRAFRDGLRADPQLRADYERLKRRAAATHAINRQGYNDAKFEWVLTTVRSLAEGGEAPDRA